MTCVVVSCNGKGRVWSFKDRLAARLNPIAQMTDVFADSAEVLLDQYGRPGVDQILQYLPEGLEKSRVLGDVDAWRTDPRRDALLNPEARDLIWKYVCRAAQYPPTDPAEIVRIIEEDRRSIEGRALHVYPRTGHGAQTATKHESEDEMGEKRDAFRMDDKGVIQFGKDDKGVAYSADNSPKTTDATKKLWALYKPGMTVEQALKAGLSRSNVRRDRRAGYITITNPPAEAKPATEAKGAAGAAGANKAA